MDHLSSKERVGAMVFYSLITFFIGPKLVGPFVDRRYPDKCMIGFVIGFAISLLIWAKYGYFLP